MTNTNGLNVSIRFLSEDGNDSNGISNSTSEANNKTEAETDESFFY